jgi:hypothetical protein
MMHGCSTFSRRKQEQDPRKDNMHNTVVLSERKHELQETLIRGEELEDAAVLELDDAWLFTFFVEARGTGSSGKRFSIAFMAELAAETDGGAGTASMARGAGE